jgi:hypothetical protein
MPLADSSPRSASSETAMKTAFLVVDTESVPDGRLVSEVKYPGKNLTPEEAIAKAQEEARETSWNKSDFLPVTFQIPVGAWLLRVGGDFALQTFACLDAPHFRPPEIVKKFWYAASWYKAKLITFNGRGFDLPLDAQPAPPPDARLGVRDGSRNPAIVERAFLEQPRDGGIDLVRRMPAPREALADLRLRELAPCQQLEATDIGLLV